MAIFTTPSGPFDYTFGPTFPALKYIEQATGGSFDYTFENVFQTRATIKGSVGGSTFQQAGRSYTIRHHNIPTLKESIKKLTRMQIFRANISRYQITDAFEKATWDAEKIYYPRTRSDGTLRIPNRYHLFISSNQRINFSNLANILEIAEQAANQLMNITAASINFGTSTMTITFNQATIPAGFNLQLFVSRTLPPASKSLAVARPTLVRIYEATDTTVLNIFSDFAAVWPNAYQTSGYLFYYIAFLVPEDTGQPQLAGQGFGEVV